MAANPYDVDISKSSTASRRPVVSTKTKGASDRTKTVNPFNQQYNFTGESNLDYSKQAQDARAGKKPQEQPKAAPPKQKENIFNKAANAVKQTAKATFEDAKNVGSKAANTVAAAGVGLGGVTKAAVQVTKGNKQGAQETINKTEQMTDKLLTNGVRGKGGYLTPTQAKSSGGGFKGLKENYIKPTAKATAEVTPYALPGGVFKGGSVAAKAAKSAALNAGISAGTDAGAQAVNTGKVDLKQTAKSAALGGVLGAAGPVLEKGLDKASAGKTARKEFVTNARTKAMLDAAAQAPVGKLDKNHEAYFNTAGKHQTLAPTKDVQFTHPPDSQPKSIENAERLMADAAFNDGNKRDPVLMHVGSDGKRTVLDGNATVAVAQKHGWDDIPASIITSKSVPTPAHVDAAKMVMERAKRADPEFQNSMATIAKDLGTDYQPGPVKDLGRSMTKIMDDYGGDHTKIKDTVRGTMILHDHTPEGIAKAVAAVQKAYPDSTIKNGYERYKSGYVDVKVNVKTPEGHTGEIILASPEMLKAKNDLGGHDLYKTFRDDTKPAAEQADALDKMNRLYDQAHASANRRLASSSDLPYSETSTRRASSGETSSPAPARTAPTERVTPVSTTRSKTPPPGRGRTASTTFSSVTKNVGRESSIPSTVAEKSEKVNGLRVYRASKQGLDPNKVTEHGISVTPNKGIARKKFGTFWNKGKVYDHVLSKDAKIMPFSEIPGDLMHAGQKPGELWPKGNDNQNYEKIVALAKSKGYDGVDLKRFGEGEIRVFDAKHLATAKPEVIAVAPPPVVKKAETGVSKVGQSVQEKAIARGLKNDFGDAAGYDKITIADQAKRAATLTQPQNRSQLLKVIAGAEPLPDGLRATALIKAIETHPQLGKDADFIRKLAASKLSSESSRSAQELRLAGERYEHSPVEAVRTVTKARADAIKRKTGKTAEKAVGAEVKAIRQAKPKVTKETWEDFVSGLAC